MCCIRKKNCREQLVLAYLPVSQQRLQRVVRCHGKACNLQVHHLSSTWCLQKYSSAAEYEQLCGTCRCVWERLSVMRCWCFCINSWNRRSTPSLTRALRPPKDACCLQRLANNKRVLADEVKGEYKLFCLNCFCILSKQIFALEGRSAEGALLPDHKSRVLGKQSPCNVSSGCVRAAASTCSATPLH